MNCKKCSRRENCDICKSAELDVLDSNIKFSCYKFKPIMTEIYTEAVAVVETNKTLTELTERKEGENS